MVDKKKRKKKANQYGFVYYIVLVLASISAYFIFDRLGNVSLAVAIFSIASVSSCLIFSDAVIASMVSMIPPMVFIAIVQINPFKQIDIIFMTVMVTLLSTFSTMWKHIKDREWLLSRENHELKMQIMRLNKIHNKSSMDKIENMDSSSKKILTLSNRILSLKQIANVLGSTLEIKKVLSKICDSCQKLLKAKSVGIYFISGKYVILKHKLSDNSSMPERVKLKGTDSKLVTFLEKHYIMSSNALDSDPAASKIYKSSSFKFQLAGFLGMGNEKIGILVIEELENDSTDENDIQLFSILLNLSSLSIRNALLYQKVRRLANQDGLTKLFTKRYFENYMKVELARSRRHNKKFSLIMSDIDHFKNFNDEHGHQAGDYVLQQTAAIFQKTVRFTDLVCRYGGEEFIIVLPETDLDGAYIVAEKIRKKVEESSYTFDGKKLNVRVSLGISTYPDHGKDITTLVKLCDNCLYHAKKTGRNKTVKYSKELENMVN